MAYIAQHDENTWPHGPVSRARMMNKVTASSSHAHIVSPSRIVDSIWIWLADCPSCLDANRSEDTPGEYAAQHEAPTGIETAQHSGSPKCGRQLNHPSPRLTGNRTFPAPSIEPVKDMPVLKKARCVATEGLEGERDEEGKAQDSDFLLSGEPGRSRSSAVERANGERSSSGRRENKLLLDWIK